MDIVEEKLPIGPEEVAEAAAVLQKYKAGKAALDKRLVDNELWFRMGHWKNYQNPMMEGKPQPSSGWLFNSIANKHADAMDNYPAPNVLPRAADDEQTARVLSSILPVVLEQADYEQVYSDTWWRKLKQGTGVKGVFWDPEAHGGLGEIAIRPMNLLMLYWEPGVEDIQTSPNFFSLRMENTRQLETRWPQLKGHSASVLDVPRFLHDGGLDTTEKSVVVDWYYKKPDAEGRVLLHYCKFCNGVVLYASENDPALAGRGFYDHGKYPFVFDPLFMEEDSPAGFGYIDVMKECQTAIDRMNHAMDENVLLASKQRYVLPPRTTVDSTTPPRWAMPCVSLRTTGTPAAIAASPTSFEARTLPWPPTPTTYIFSVFIEISSGSAFFRQAGFSGIEMRMSGCSGTSGPCYFWGRIACRGQTCTQTAQPEHWVGSMVMRSPSGWKAG